MRSWLDDRYCPSCGHTLEQSELAGVEFEYCSHCGTVLIQDPEPLSGYRDAHRVRVLRDALSEIVRAEVVRMSSPLPRIEDHEREIEPEADRPARRVLVAYASKHGATAEIARVITRAMAQRHIHTVLLPVAYVNRLDTFDAVVLGSAVYVGRWLLDALQFVTDWQEELRSLPVWLFSSGPIGDPPVPSQAVDIESVFERTGAREHRVFAGKLDRRQLSFPERAVMALLHAPDGDYRDWPAIHLWAHDIAATLQQEWEEADRLSRRRLA